MNISTKEKTSLQDLRVTLCLAWFRTYADNRKKGMTKEKANTEGYAFINGKAFTMEEVKTLEKLIDKLLK